MDARGAVAGLLGLVLLASGLIGGPAEASRPALFPDDVDVIPAAGGADFTIDRPVVGEGRVVRFQDTSQLPDGRFTVRRDWDMGDGSEYRNVVPSISHLFPDQGTYDVELKVHDNTDEVHTRTRQVTVQNEPPEVEIEVASQIGKNELFDLRLRVWDPGMDDWDSVEWDLTSTPSHESLTIDHTHSRNQEKRVGPFLHQISSFSIPEGSYTLRLEATDKDGATAVTTKKVTILGEGQEPPAPPPDPEVGTCLPDVTTSGEEYRFWQRINAYRGQSGLRPMRRSATLGLAARGHAEWMSEGPEHEEWRLGHTGEGGSTPKDRAVAAGYPAAAAVAENVAVGPLIWSAGDIPPWKAGDVLLQWKTSMRYVTLTDSDGTEYEMLTGHNKAMLSPSWRATGVGLAPDINGMSWWANKFGTVDDCPGGPPADFLGDGITDVSIFRPSNGNWYVQGMPSVRWGVQNGDVPVPGDYDGDGTTDIAVYRPSNGTWYIRGITNTRWGVQQGDVPVPGDYDGDGITDIAIYRPSNGRWYIRGGTHTTWGIQPGDVPVPGDYDGDGTTDIAVYRPSNGNWYVRGVANTRWGVQAGDVPVPGDYDGDGTTDIAVYRPSNGTWYVRGQFNVTWGVQAGDVPVPGDYDGDGTTDIAVYRPSNGYWYIRGITNTRWGIQNGDIPLPLPAAIRTAFFA